MTDNDQWAQADPDRADEQAVAEGLDEDELDPVDFPPDRPSGVGAWGTTQVEEEGGESVRQRAAQEDPRFDLREPERPIPGLIEPDDGFDGDVTGESVAVEGDELDLLSAEEAAVHLIDEPDPG